MKKTLRTSCFALTIILICACTSATACSCIGSYNGIKSVDELGSYEFVALVKITSETVNPFSDTTSFRTARLGFRIIEKFKGKDIRELTEYDIQSSCEMGIEIGEEWVLFASTRSGALAIGACGRDSRYRGRDGVRDWHFKRGIQELEDLRRLYSHSQRRKRDGEHTERYPDGKIEVEETYRDGLRNGVRTVYHSNGKVWGKQIFVDDSLQGKSEWFFASGQLDDQKFYRKGILINKSRVYFDTSLTDQRKQYLIREFYETEDSLRRTYSRVQVWLEALYDYNGQVVSSTEYSRWGKIQQERLYHHQDSTSTIIYYHDNAQVKSINHFKNYTRPYGHYDEYDPQGNPIKSWDYDADGKQINIRIPK